jgi:branched-subunit amino acid aminotransferase/4-amino-4-deoxychorismate lyase
MQETTIRDAIPYPRSNVLPGVTRGAILDYAQEMKIEVKLAAIDVSQLLDADEVFITNSIMGVMPVCRLEQKLIGADKPGTITMRMMERFQSELG